MSAGLDKTLRVANEGVEKGPGGGDDLTPILKARLAYLETQAQMAAMPPEMKAAMTKDYARTVGSMSKPAPPRLTGLDKILAGELRTAAEAEGLTPSPAKPEASEEPVTEDDKFISFTERMLKELKTLKGAQ